MGKKLPKRLRHDSRDTVASERKLRSVCHYLWRELKQARKSQTVSEIRALSEAVEQVWELKRQLRRELARKRAGQAKRTRNYFRSLALTKRQERDQTCLPFEELNAPS